MVISILACMYEKYLYNDIYLIFQILLLSCVACAIRARSRAQRLSAGNTLTKLRSKGHGKLIFSEV